MTQSLFDEQHFLQSFSGDKELAQELLAAFMDDSPVRSSSLAEALDNNDASSASRLAHSLKGMCGVVRAKSLVDLAYSMENASKEGDLGKTRKIYPQFKELLAAAHEEMQAFISN